MKQAIYQSVVYRDGKYYFAQCLNIDVSSFGETEEEALSNLQEVLELYLEDATVTPIKVDHPTLHTLRVQNT